MGITLAKLGRYCDCFEEVDEYEVEISKVKRIQKYKRNHTGNSEEGVGESELKGNEPEATINNMEKLRPAKVATPERPQRSHMMETNNILDSSFNPDNSGVGLGGQPDEEVLRASRERTLKERLKRIRERRKQRERPEEQLGVKKGHLLNVIENRELFMNKEELQQFDQQQRVQ